MFQVAFEAAAGTGLVDAADSGTRATILKRLKKASTEGRAAIEELLMEDGGGTECAKRLSDLQDNLIRSIYGFASEQTYPPVRPEDKLMAVVAVGGYGRGTLAPGSDIDLLFISPSHVGPRFRKIVEYILYLLWDMDFKVGHATRSVQECLRLSRTDMTIRTAILESRLIAGEEKMFNELVRAVRRRYRERHRG